MGIDPLDATFVEMVEEEWGFTPDAEMIVLVRDHVKRRDELAAELKCIELQIAVSELLDEYDNTDGALPHDQWNFIVSGAAVVYSADGAWVASVLEGECLEEVALEIVRVFQPEHLSSLDDEAIIEALTIWQDRVIEAVDDGTDAESFATTMELAATSDTPEGVDPEEWRASVALIVGATAVLFDPGDPYERFVPAVMDAARYPSFNELFQAAAAFSIQGYLIDPDTISEVDALEESLEEVEETGARLWMVALGSEPPGGATDLAEQIFQFVVGEGTVVVIAPESIGWASDGETWTEGQLDDATKTAFEGGSYDEAAALFFAALET